MNITDFFLLVEDRAESLSQKDGKKLKPEGHENDNILSRHDIKYKMTLNLFALFSDFLIWLARRI